MRFEEMLDAVRARAGSDRKASVLLGVSQQQVSRWRTGRDFPGDDQARRIAEVLQLDAAFVLAVIHGERAKSKETRAVWERVAQTFGKAATVALVAAAPFIAPPEARAGAFDKTKFRATTQYTFARFRRRALGVALTA